MPRPLAIVGGAPPYELDVVESALRSGREVVCVDNHGGADATMRTPFTLGLSSAAHRAAAARAAHAAGWDAPESLVDPTAIVPSTAEVAHGAYVNAGAVLGS